FARFNTIISSRKALDKGFSSKNYVRKFLKTLHPKWSAKIMAIEETKDLSSLALDELIGNLKVHEVVMEKDSRIYRGKKERVRQEREEKKSFRQRDEKKGKSDRKCFRCGNPNHLIGDCPKLPRNKDQKAFIGDSWSDSENDTEDKTNDETCLMAQSSNEDCSKEKDWDVIALDIHAAGDAVNHCQNIADENGAHDSLITANNIEPKDVNEALKDKSWVVAMQEELNQYVANDVWDLVPLPMSQSVIGTKWVFRNKLDENGKVFKNKARLVAQGYNQQEGIDYEETYTTVARLELIRILLAIACANDFKLYQIDVKSDFPNGFTNKEVYVAQPPGFIDFEKPNYVYKLKKALYGLKHAPRSWYDRLKAFLIKYEYSIGMVDNTLFTKKLKSLLIIVQIYVDDIVFGSMCQNLCYDFAKIMHDEFKMSMMGELNFFLGLQIKQMEDKIFFNQSKYTKEMLKKFGLEDSKPTKTPMLTKISLTKDYEAGSVDSTKYQELLNETFDETPPPSMTSPLVDDDLDEEEAIKITKK
nr:retrovirus-related Pol polyprotein from transposon TNT 1-94 [Tanacetum cinerariifolium]